VIFFALMSHIVTNQVEHRKNVTPGEMTLARHHKVFECDMHLIV
jgi:hypothetical protein